MSQTNSTSGNLFLEVNDYWLKQIVTADGWNLATSFMQFIDQVRFLNIPTFGPPTTHRKMKVLNPQYMGYNP